MLCNCYRHTGEPAVAVHVLRCSECGRQFGRCEACSHKPGKVQNSMALHWEQAHRSFARNRLRRLGPGREWL